MATPVLICADICCKMLPESDKATNKIIFTGVAVDATVAITAFVVGILGIFSVITMPAAAAYGLIGLGGAVVTSWLAFITMIAISAAKDKCNSQRPS